MIDKRHEYMLKLFNQNSELTIFDLGANDGTDTIWFRNNFINSTIHSFELDERNFDLYLNKIQDDKVILNKIGVSNINGQSLVYLSTDTKWGHINTSCSSIKKPTEKMYQTHDWIEFNKTTVVDTITLDTYCEKMSINHIDLIWCDIQGSEKEMILGAEKILKKTKYLAVEILNIDIYENSLTKLNEFQLILPDFELLCDWGGDALFKNKKIN